MTTRHGKFIVVDGLDGSGKGACIKALKQKYPQGKGFVYTREPGGTPLAEELREIILREPTDQYTEICMLTAARRDHVLKVIVPNLMRGVHVVSDRYAASTIAYQVYGRILDPGMRGQMKEAVRFHTRFAEADWSNSDPPFFIKPQYIFLDVEPSVGAERIRARHKAGGESNHFDREKQGFFERVRKGYLMFPKIPNIHLCRAEEVGWNVIDAHPPEVEVVATFLAKVDEIIATP